MKFVLDIVSIFKALPFLSVLLFSLFPLDLIAQSDFEEIMKSDRNINSLGAGQQLSDKWPIPELRKRFKTIIVTADHLANMDVNQFIEDMNQNPRITMLTINTSGSKDLTDADLQSIPLHKLKYVRHLAYKRYGMSGMEISSVIDWGEILKMSTLEYLYLQPTKRFGRQGGEVNVPKEVVGPLANQLIGYVNLGYNGEFDSVDNKFECLGIRVTKKQKYQTLSVLNKSQSLKTLHVSVDTFYKESLKNLLVSETLQTLKIGPVMNGALAYADVQNIKLRLPSLKYLNCFSFDLPIFQALAPQLSDLEIKTADLNVRNIGSFLSTAVNINALKLNIQKDSLIRFPINPAMPLTKFEVSGKLVELPNEFCQFTRLERLNLRYNRLRLLPACLSEFTELKHVDLSTNRLEVEPPFWEWSKLETLNLERNLLKNLSDRWQNNPALRILKLNSNPISGTIESLAECRSLEELFLIKTCITSLPTKINQLEKLLKLRIDKSAFTSFDENYQFECDKYLTHLPSSLAQLKNLEFISVSGQKGLSDEDLEIVLSTASDSIEINFSKASLTTLPESGWQNTGVKKLDLSSNEIESISSSTLNTTIPDFNLRGNDLGILNQNITTKTEKLIWQYSAGIDVSEELKNQADVVDAVIGVANKYYARPEENPVLDLIPLVLSLDTLNVLSKLKANNYGKALFEAGRYEEAEKYLSLAIKKQKEGCFIYANGISSLYFDRYKCYLELQDTTAAISDLKTVENDYGFFTSFEVFELELAQNNLSEVDKIKESVVAKYRELRSPNEDFGSLLTELSILEIYLVTNDQESFREHTSHIESFEEEEYLPIFEYLKLLSVITQKQNPEISIEQFQEKLIAQKFVNEKWSCDLVKYWSKQLSPDKRAQVLILNSMICPVIE